MNSRITISLVVVAALAVVGIVVLRKSGSSFDQRACTGTTFTLTGALLPTFDYAELRETDNEKPLEMSGERCRGAKDKGDCERKVASRSSKEGWRNGSDGRRPGHHYLVATRGDDVFLIDNVMIKLPLALAPIDSPAKAAAIAFVERGIAPSCEGSVRAVEQGFEVHLKTDSCRGPTDEILRVSTEGALEVVKSDVKPPTCVGARETKQPAASGV